MSPVSLSAQVDSARVPSDNADRSDIPARFTSTREAPDYERRVVRIAMRDGVRLNTTIFLPGHVKRGPILLDRSPYALREIQGGSGGSRLRDNLIPTFAGLAERGYIIVAQDVRGKHGSEGDYRMKMPLRGPLNATSTDHSTDAWDTIDWLVKNLPQSNGRVATIGTSYEGFTALMSLIDPHPALKAVVPINPVVDVWKGDDYFHNGAFRQEMMSYIYNQTATNASDERWFALRHDDYDAFMHYGSAGALGRAMGMDQLPYWRRLVRHPDYDAYWQEQALDTILARRPLTVPTLLIHSQWDQEDIYGAPAVWRALKDKAGGNLHLVIGPWFHGQPNYEGEALGPLRWGSDTAAWFREHVLAPFLDARLKDDRPTGIARVTAFETGTNEWRRLSDWPAAGRTLALGLSSNRTLTFNSEASSNGGYDEYVSDPATPVTYRPRPLRPVSANGSTWRYWLADDQRYVSSRPDVLTYATDVLASPVHVAGQPLARLFASTSGTDSDWVVKLIDVYPDVVPGRPEMAGYQLAIAMDILRGRYRDDPAKPMPLTPHRPTEYRIVLPDVNHVFLPGHRIMVQIQSSWFPLYDRNPQTFVPNIFHAKPADYRKATQRVFFGAAHPSAIDLPIVAVR